MTDRRNPQIPHVPFPTPFEGMPASLGPGLRTASGAKRGRDGNLRFLPFKISWRATTPWRPRLVRSVGWHTRPLGHVDKLPARKWRPPFFLASGAKKVG